MPKPDYIIGLPEDIRKEFMNRPVKCPYTKGKMTLQKIKKRSIDAIKEVIGFLGKRTKSFKTYDEYNAQMNDEKATEYILQSQIFQLWTATANKIVNYASDEITVKDIRAMITLDYGTVIAILQTKFSMINIIIKEKYPDIYQEAQEKSDLIKKLREDGIRKSMGPEGPNEFDGMAENPILNQLAANTTSYLQYINSQYSDENQVINISNAPRFRYFSAQFGGGLRKVLLDTMGNYIMKNNMKRLYGYTKTGMSPQAEEQLDARIQATVGKSYKDLAIQEDGRLPAMMDTPDGEIYGCPVQGSFRHFYRLVILTLKEHIEKL